MILPFWLFLLPVLPLIPGLADFPYPSEQAAYSDLAISHYPNAVFLVESLTRSGVLPLWSPAILSGYPFAANPLAGMWYPPGWLALLLPLPMGFNLLVALHLLWGGLGLYFLLRQVGLRREAALLGGLAFEALPKLFAHYGAGHLTLLYAVPWTPWLLFSAKRSSDFSVAPPAILALIFLADVRWAAYAGIFWLAYSFLNRAKRTYLLLQVGLAGLLAAPLALPLWEYTRQATRSHLAPQDVFTYSLPVGRLLGLIFPDLGGFHEWALYPGGLVLALAVAGLAWRPVSCRARFWIWTAGLAVLFSLGSHLPGLALLARLPGFDLLRVPPRALFLLGLSLTVLAAYALDHLLAGPAPASRRRARLALTGLAGATLTLAAGVWVAGGRLPLNFAWGAAAILAGAAWISFGLRRQALRPNWLVVLAGLCLLDLLGVDRAAFVSRSKQAVLKESQAVAEYLVVQPGQYRIYSPSYSLPQQTAARYHLELADGVDPLQLEAYAAFMQPASGIPRAGYSVTLPPFRPSQGAAGTEANPARANAAYRPDPALLGLLNVGYVAADFDLFVDGLALEARFGETRLYRNRLVLPRAWIQPFDAPPGKLAEPVSIDVWSPNRIDLSLPETSGSEAHVLVLSELAYPGWQVRVDGQPAEMHVVGRLLRGVHLNPDSRKVNFVFRPISVFTGLALAVMGIGLALCFIYNQKIRATRT